MKTSLTVSGNKLLWIYNFGPERRRTLVDHSEVFWKKDGRENTFWRANRCEEL